MYAQLFDAPRRDVRAPWVFCTILALVGSYQYPSLHFAQYELLLEASSLHGNIGATPEGSSAQLQHCNMYAGMEA